MIVHRLPVAVDGNTHFKEGQFRINRATYSVYFELHGGTAEDDAETGLPIPETFVPNRYGWVGNGFSGKQRWDDFETFLTDFMRSPPDGEQRTPGNWFFAAALQYSWLVDQGLRPLGEG